MRSIRTQRVLLVALALSLLVHLVVALVVHRSTGSRDSEAEVVTIEHRSSVTKMQTPPPPRPHVKPVPHPAPSSRPVPARKHATQTIGSGGTGRIVNKPTAPPPTETPAPAATVVANSCAHSDQDAAVTVEPPQPDIPIAARSEGTAGTAVVKVQLDAQGAVTRVDVSQSTGNSALDLVAASMARAATYTPALHDCKPVAADYTFSVKFFAW